MSDQMTNILFECDPMRNVNNGKKNVNSDIFILLQLMVTDTWQMRIVEDVYPMKMFGFNINYQRKKPIGLIKSTEGTWLRMNIAFEDELKIWQEDRSFLPGRYLHLDPIR